MIIKEFKCPKHGFFEASHPICHQMGCDSEGVERAFLTPPGYKSDKTKFADNSLDRIAKSYGLSDLSNPDGAAAKRHEDQVIWGKQGVANYDGMLQQASQPTVIERNGQTFVAESSGMKAAAPIVQRRQLPPAQVRVLKSDSEDRARVTTS